MSKGRILVVDDESIVRMSCTRTLGPEGYDVKTVASGIDGLKLLKEEHFDIVLTDLKMPDMDGIEVLRMVRDGWPDTQVIIITGYQSVTSAVQSIKLGAFDYIEKPFTPEALLAAVRRALEQKKGSV